MGNLSISNIRERIFNQTKYEQTVARASNPFAQTSFKGNVLSADVFESSKKEATAQNKLTYSALVGSLANMGATFRQRMESMVAFGHKMTEQIAGAWEDFANTQFPTFKNAAAGMVEMLNTPIGGNKYANMSIAQIRPMLQDGVAKLECGEF